MLKEDMWELETNYDLHEWKGSRFPLPRALHMAGDGVACCNWWGELLQEWTTYGACFTQGPSKLFLGKEGCMCDPAIWICALMIGCPRITKNCSAMVPVIVGDPKAPKSWSHSWCISPSWAHCYGHGNRYCPTLPCLPYLELDLCPYPMSLPLAFGSRSVCTSPSWYRQLRAEHFARTC